MTKLDTVRLATEKQTSYIKALIVKHQCRDEFAARVINAIDTETLPIDKASDIIGYLTKQAKRPTTVIATPVATASTDLEEIVDVPQGYYAVKCVTGANDLDFFRVDKPDTGKWKGHTFVKRIVGGHPELGVPKTLIPKILQRIVDHGVERSAVLYGVEIGRCYVCNRTLTDDLSRELGIGPHCRAGKI